MTSVAGGSPASKASTLPRHSGPKDASISRVWPTRCGVSNTPSRLRSGLSAGSGSVTKSPNLANYADGASVTLTAVPAAFANDTVDAGLRPVPVMVKGAATAPAPITVGVTVTAPVVTTEMALEIGRAHV